MTEHGSWMNEDQRDATAPHTCFGLSEESKYCGQCGWPLKLDPMQSLGQHQEQSCQVTHVSVGIAAQRLCVSPATVRKLFDRGLLRGFRLPSANGRRGDMRICVKCIQEIVEGRKT